MRFIIVLFLLVTSFAYSQWTPYNVNMQVKVKFRADKQIYFPLGADSGKVWVCINDSTGLGEWRTVGGGGSIDTSNFWNINGNAGTTSANFLGTTDYKDLFLKRNGNTNIEISSDNKGEHVYIMDSLGNKLFESTSMNGDFSANLGSDTTYIVADNGGGELDISSATIIIHNPSSGSSKLITQCDSIFNDSDTTTYLGTETYRYKEVNTYIANVTGSFKYANGTQGAGKILTSDANGLAYWDTISGGGGATGATGATGSTGATGATGNTGATGTTVPNSLTFSYGITGATSYDGSSAQTIKADTSTSGINLATQGYADRGDVWVLLSTVTASNSATVDFTGLDSGSYVIFYTNVIPTTTSTTLNFRYGTGGTPTYQTSDYAYSVSFNLNTGTTIITSNSTSAGSFVLHGVTTGTGEGVSGVLTMLNPSGTSIYHPMTFTANDFNGGKNYYFAGGGCWKSTTAVTAGRFLFSGGNIASGTFKIYKIK